MGLNLHLHQLQMLKTLEMYYQNTRGLRSKAVEFMSNILLSPSEIICLTETWLCPGISINSYFPPTFTVFRQDRDYANTGMKLGGGVLIAVNSLVQCHRRKDLESYAECVWVELPASDGFNYLIGNYYFPPLFSDLEFIEHFESLQKKVDFSKFRVQILGDFNLPGIDWGAGINFCTTGVTSRKAAWLLSFINFFLFLSVQ